MQPTRRETAFYIALSNWAIEPAYRTTFYRLLHAIIEHSREADEYEADPEPRPLGDAADGMNTQRVQWGGYTWTLTDFGALIVSHFYDTTSHVEGSGESSSVEEIDKPREPHLAALDTYPATERDELALFCFFLAISSDSRAMRVCCKQSSVLSYLELDCPAQQHICNLRAAVPLILDRYANTDKTDVHWTWPRCLRAIQDAKGTGYVSQECDVGALETRRILVQCSSPTLFKRVFNISAPPFGSGALCLPTSDNHVQ